MQHYRGRGFFCILLALGLDQLSKWIMVQWVMTPPRAIEVTPFFNLILVGNKGISFGLMNSGQWTLLLSLLALGITLVVLVWLWRATSQWVALGCGLVIGGAIGNLIDRLRFGAVIDFLDVHALGYHWPTFNVADSAIVLGVGFILLDGLHQSPERLK